MDLANYLELFGRVISLGLSIVLLWMNWGIIALLVANASSYCLIHLGSAFLAWRIAGLPVVPRATFSLASSRRLVHYGGGVLGITLLSMLMAPFNNIVITRYTSLSSLAVYEIAHRMAGQIKTMLNPALRALMPEVSRLGAAETPERQARIRAINLRVTRFVLLVAGSVYLVLLFGAEPILALWLRRAFSGALPTVFRILLTTSFISLLGGCAYNTLMGLGRVRDGFRAHLLAAATNIGVVISALVLWPPLTLTTVAYASLAAYAAGTLYLVLTMRALVFKPKESVPAVSPVMVGT